MVRMVCIGGGTGLPTLLSGLRELAGHKAGKTGRPRLSVTAVVTVADSGGSSGALREMFRMPAVGDIRNCLVALASNGSQIADLCQHRFATGDGLKGHPLGNLLLTALYQRTGGLSTAVELAREIFQSCGAVLPVSEHEVHLCAQYDDGSVVDSQARLRLAGRRIERIWLEPADVCASPAALDAIASADVIVLSPGSLYSSIIAALLIPGVVEAIHSSKAITAYVCNLMTQPGETDGFTAADHVRTLRGYLGSRGIDLVLVNSGRIRSSVEQQYQMRGARSVAVDQREIARLGSIPVCADVLGLHPSGIRHDSTKLARVLYQLTVGALRARDLMSGFESAGARAGLTRSCR